MYDIVGCGHVFGLFGCEIPERRVHAVPIIIAFDISEQSLPGFAVCRPAALMDQFDLQRNADEKRLRLWKNSKALHQGLKAAGFQLGTEEPQSAIISVIMPDLESGVGMWEALLREGLYVNLARPPATPANMTLLRCSLCSEHSAGQVEKIINTFTRVGESRSLLAGH